MRIFLVEDNHDLSEALLRALRSRDYAVDWVTNGCLADSVLGTETYDLVILDLLLPKLDGLEVLKRLRGRDCRVPVLVLTALGEVQDRVTGLDLGADDYLPKPFALAELEARVRALLRRSQGKASSLLVHGTLRFDTLARRLSVNGKPVVLPRRELCLLEVLLAHAGQVVSKEQIAAHLFGFDDEAGLNAIELYMCRLRKRLALADLKIRTIRGLGYLLEEH